MFDLEKMADGLATRIGENGSRLSGGESQRLRIARALVRGNARLVLLDEPFSGMDADQRERMRRHAIDRWPEATLLWVSHHVRETLTFPRVLVFEHGRIVEDGAPQSLLRQTIALCRNGRGRRCAERASAWTPWRSGRVRPHRTGSTMTTIDECVWTNGASPQRCRGSSIATATADRTPPQRYPTTLRWKQR